MRFPNWLNPAIPLKRWSYLLSGLTLFALKYNLDRLISYTIFDRTWYFTDYFEYVKIESITKQAGDHLIVTLAITAIPFIVVGTILTIRRLLDAGLPRWTVCLFFLPYLNLVLFGLLCMLPTSMSGARPHESHRKGWLDRLIPARQDKAAFLAALVTALLASFGVWFSTEVMEDYGGGLFMGIPFMQGLAASLLYGYRKERHLGECFGVAIISVGALGLLIFLAAIEGLLCIVMAMPIVIPLAMLGALLGYFIQKRTKAALPPAILILVFIPLAGWVEKQGHKEAPLVPVTTGVIIDRSRQEVWNQLVTFNNMDQPTEMLFKAGVAYPVRAIIEGKGVGSVRRCQFSTGDFVEPITVWDEPNLLRFSVEKMPPPLVEWSIYKDLQLPHLENYFVSEKGQFKLTAINEHQTLLEGTTWYRHKIWPRLYWKLWSDYILHEIHLRVLNHIKREAEGK